MLTKEAFNALLKTLEEPPNYVIFVLATTELHKVPDTIQSRSQVYTFVSPTHEKIVELVQSVAEKESVDLSEENASLIAFRAHGSYRDSLSELQKYISSDSYHESINDIGSLVESLTNYLTDPESTNLSHILETVQTIPDPKIVFELLLQEVSDRLYKKVTNDFQTKVGSVTLKTVLKYRNYYDQSSTLQIQRAGLMLLVMESNKL